MAKNADVKKGTALWLMKVKKGEMRAVAFAAEFVARKAREALGTSAGDKTGPLTYTDPSKPGEAPHARTGHLRMGIYHQNDPQKAVSRVGWQRNVIYGYYHEVGIHYSKAGYQRRPHLLPALVDNLNEIKGLMARTMKAATA